MHMSSSTKSLSTTATSLELPLDLPVEVSSNLVITYGVLFLPISWNDPVIAVLPRLADGGRVPLQSQADSSRNVRLLRGISNNYLLDYYSKPNLTLCRYNLLNSLGFPTSSIEKCEA